MYEDPSDEPLDALLRDHFAGELDPQLGRALASFEQHAGDGQVQRNQRWSTRRLSLLASMAAALAATIAVAIVLNQPPRRAATDPSPASAGAQPSASPALPQAAAVADSPEPTTDPTVPPTQPPQPADALAAGPGERSVEKQSPADEQVLIKQGVEWRVLDSEIMDVDSGTPVRKLRRQRLEEREYLDRQHGARMKLFLPREEVRYESIPTK